MMQIDLFFSFYEDVREKRVFILFSFPVTLIVDLYTPDTRVKDHVSVKFEVSTALKF